MEMLDLCLLIILFHQAFWICLIQLVKVQSRYNTNLDCIIWMACYIMSRFKGDVCNSVSPIYDYSQLKVSHSFPQMMCLCGTFNIVVYI